jgi:hypothetical protein
MAINVFKNVTANLTTSGATLYTAPTGYTGIVLLAQISNLTGNTVAASMFVQQGGSQTSLATDFDIPANDAAGMLSGKLVLEVGQQIFASASANASAQITLSILESQN